MGGGNSTLKPLKGTFLNLFLSEKDWQVGENVFLHEVVERGKLNVDDYNMIYVLSGQFTLSYLDKHKTDITDTDLTKLTIKTLNSGDFCCIFDVEPIDVFDPDRKLQLHLTCTEVGQAGQAECIAVTREKLTEFLKLAHLHPLRHIFLVRPSALMLKNPLFEGLGHDEVSLLETSMRLVHVPPNSAVAMKTKGRGRNGDMAVLLHGKCVTGAQTVVDSSVKRTEHCLHNPDEPMQVMHSEKESSSSHPGSVEVFPCPGMMPGDRLITAGSCIGAELCLRDDMDSLSTVVTIDECIFGMICTDDLKRVNDVHEGILAVMQRNLRTICMESMRDAVPLLWDISPSDLLAIAGRSSLLSAAKGETILMQGGDAERFFMVVQGEMEVLEGEGDRAVPLRTLTQGQYFGEVALTLGHSFFPNIRLQSRSILLCLEKKDFLEWSNRTPQLLAELNIRMQGLDVPLIHIMRHSRGYAEFLKFLKGELAPEGGIFWKAADLMQDRCELWLSWRHLLAQSECGEDSSGQKRIEPNMSSSRVKIPYAPSRSVEIADPEHSHVTISDNVQSLLEMAEGIFENHLKDKSIHQINIPQTMLRSITADYELFLYKARAMADSTKKGCEPNLSFYFEVLDMAVLLFGPAKHEVYMLLKDDNFSRWNKTTSFEDFISDMHPYVM